MLFSSLSWVMLTLTLLVALPGALAASSPKRPKKSASTRVTVETYPAIEDGEMTDPTASLKPTRGRKTQRVQTLGAPAPYVPVDTAPAPIASETKPATKFVEVPVEKRAQILQRMKICQSLFQATGRAYDYRSMTTAELEKELASVTVASNAAPNAAPVVRPATEINAAPSEPDPILDIQE